MKKQAKCLWIAFRSYLFSLVFAARVFAAPLPVPDEEISTILRDYIERDHWGVGIVVGIVDERGKRIVSYGKMDHGESPLVDGDTLFEIGSITKTFTTLLLQDMIARGEMSLDDPLEKYLPASYPVSDPAWGVTKQLSVKFSLHGATRTASAREGEAIEIPPGAKILAAVYGDLASHRTFNVTTNVAERVKQAGDQGTKLVIENKLAQHDVPLRVPAWEARKITLRDLATHTSGLPRDLDGDLYPFLSHCRLPRRPGRKAEYSNLAMGLLAHAIERKAGTNYETLVRDRICRPLRMESTCVVPTPELRKRLARSHNKENATTGDTADLLASLPGAGALRSTAQDLLSYVAAEIGLEPSPLTPLMQQTHAVQFRQAFGEIDLGLPWFIRHRPGAELITHGGSTGGHEAFIGFDKEARRGVVILSNRDDLLGQAVRPLGMYLLTPPGEAPQLFPLPPDAFNSYAGLYEFRPLPQAVLMIRPAGDRLITQFVNYVANEWLPVSDTDFLNRWHDGTTLRFNKTLLGQSTALFTNPDGKTWRAVRIHEEVPAELTLPITDPLQPDECVPRTGSDLQGSWAVVARPWYWPFTSLHGTLRISERSPARFRANFDFPRTGVTGLPVFVHYHYPSIELIARSGDGLFKGTMNADHTRISGHYIVGGHRIRTVIRRMEQ